MQWAGEVAARRYAEGMDLSAGDLFASLLVSTVGFAIFAYGKKQQRIPHLACGVLMMAFPYFVPGLVPMLAIAGGLIGLTVLASKRGL